MGLEAPRVVCRRVVAASFHSTLRLSCDGRSPDDETVLSVSLPGDSPPNLAVGDGPEDRTSAPRNRVPVATAHVLSLLRGHHDRAGLRPCLRPRAPAASPRAG